MTHPGKSARDGRWRLSLTLLVTGALVFFGIFLTEAGRELIPALWEIAQDPLEYLDVGEGLAVSAFLLLTLLTLCSPAMAILLARNGLMRNFFRVLSTISTATLGGCAIAWHDTADAILYVLVVSSIFNLAGLFVLRAEKPPQPHP